MFSRTGVVSIWLRSTSASSHTLAASGGNSFSGAEPGR
jgi:hypothetical protein